MAFLYICTTFIDSVMDTIRIFRVEALIKSIIYSLQIISIVGLLKMMKIRLRVQRARVLS